jgi:Protein of unknown function (DUF4241)
MRHFLFCLLAAFFIVSCINKTSSLQSDNISKVEDIAIKVKQPEIKRMLAYPEVFELAYIKGTTVLADSVPVVFYTHEIGKLKIKSGKIIACDPANLGNHKAFTQTFPIGEYPVQLSVAKYNDDERVAFSRIYFSNKPVKHWDVALLPGQKSVSLKDSIIYGHSIDFGTGVFADEVISKNFATISDTEWKKMFIAEMNKNARNTWSYNLHEVGKLNVAVFSTGLGDGYYATYIGYDENNNVCRLLTDFSLIRW